MAIDEVARLRDLVALFGPVPTPRRRHLDRESVTDD